MALKRDEYWWIERKGGKIAIFGRQLGNWGLTESGNPELFSTKKEAQAHCREGEKPVKVRIVKVGK